jgi:hypothetical protein
MALPILTAAGGTRWIAAEAEACAGWAVADFPRFEYAMRDVRRAGEIIASELPWTEANESEIRRAFEIANNYREAHAYPMRSVRCQLLWYMRSLGIEGVTAARLKRMQSIRGKLGRVKNLNQLQDLGGCRAVLQRIDDVRTLTNVLRERGRHELRNEDPYIDEPKKDGYRSHHLMLNYKGRGAARVFDGRRIEVQIRTRLQHAWATAVEAVGLFRGENLKAGQGSPGWLRLFLLISAEFAELEGCPIPPNVPEQVERIAEIKALDQALSAVTTLDTLSQAVRWTDEYVTSRIMPTYYLIKFDHSTKSVDVEPYFAPKSAMLQYENAEYLDNMSRNETKNVVLVEADKLENLVIAYPNYFGDVQLFRLQMRNIVKGNGVKEYYLKPQEGVAPRPKENPDIMWLKRGRARWR